MSERDAVLEKLLGQYYHELADSDAEVSDNSANRLARAAYRAGMLRAADKARDARAHWRKLEEHQVADGCKSVERAIREEAGE